MDTKNIIWEIVADSAIAANREKWEEKSNDVLKLVVELEPDKPEDDSKGFLAYNVPDKPRMKMKTGRFLTRKLSLNSGFLSDSVIQQIAEKINMALFGDVQHDIRLLHGKDITQAYEDHVGSRSCMTGSCAEYTRLYEMNPDRFALLVMVNGNNSARAIVHKLDCGSYYMDRVYTDSTTLAGFMIDYADKQGWFTRSHDGASFSGASCDRKLLQMSGLEWKEGCVPYMDTMTYGTIGSDGKLNISATYGDLDLTSTDGTIEEERCCNCGSGVCRDDAFSVVDDIYCESCYCDNFYSCENCGEPVANDDVIKIEDTERYYCECCAERYATKCDSCGNWYFEGIVEVHNGDRICESCLEDYTCCEDCSEFYPHSDMVCINDDFWVCEHCAEDYHKCTDCGGYTKEELVDDKCPDCCESIIDYEGQLDLPLENN